MRQALTLLLFGTIGLGWRPASVAWQLNAQRRRFNYDGRVRHVIEVAPDSGGRPGERLLAPSEAAYVSHVWPGEEGRRDFGVMVGMRSIMQVACFGPSHRRGTPEDSALMSINSLYDAMTSLLSAPEVAQCIGLPAVKFVALMSGGSTLTEYHFEYKGWSFVTGIVVHPKDGLRAMERATASLATWEWLDLDPVGDC